MFSPGLNAEDRLRTLLERYGCTLIEGPRFDHEHKLDFVVSGFPQIPWLFHLGVQVTTRIDDRTKQATFLKIVRENPVTNRNIYLEMEPGVNLEKGGAFVVLTALVEFLHNRLHSDDGVIGLRVSSDLKYHFYDLAHAVALPGGLSRPASAGSMAPPPFARTFGQQPSSGPPSTPLAVMPPSTAQSGGGSSAGPSAPGLPSMPAVPQGAMPVYAPKPEAVGRITRYNIERSIGLIVSQDGTEYFIHKSNFSDLMLRMEVESLASHNEWFDEPIAVQFVDGGRVPGKKNNIAQLIRRHVPNSVLAS
jgi:hypothetical protein